MRLEGLAEGKRSSLFRPFISDEEKKSLKRLLLTSLRREKEAFEFLIKEKGSLVLPDLVEEDFNVENNAIMNNAVSRKAGGALAA
jgi:hypothetical protein